MKQVWQLHGSAALQRDVPADWITAIEYPDIDADQETKSFDVEIVVAAYVTMNNKEGPEDQTYKEPSTRDAWRVERAVMESKKNIWKCLPGGAVGFSGGRSSPSPRYVHRGYSWPLSSLVRTLYQSEGHSRVKYI